MKFLIELEGAYDVQQRSTKKALSSNRSQLFFRANFTAKVSASSVVNFRAKSTVNSHFVLLNETRYLFLTETLLYKQPGNRHLKPFFK